MSLKALLGEEGEKKACPVKYNPSHLSSLWLTSTATFRAQLDTILRPQRLGRDVALGSV